MTDESNKPDEYPDFLKDRVVKTDADINKRVSAYKEALSEAVLSLDKDLKNDPRN